jgi:RNA polymerase sigma-70 factor (ECF subfamily)
LSTQVQHITLQSSVEEQIIYLLKDRDKAAIRMIFDHYGVVMLNIIRRVIKDEAMAQDVLQDSLMKVWRNAASYDPEKGGLFTWLTRISRNAAIDKTRTKDFRLTETSRKAAALVTISDTVSQDTNLDRLYVDQLVEQLPDKQRELIDLAYFQGYTQKEISENLKMPLGTVKTRIRLAIKHLRSII